MDLVEWTIQRRVDGGTARAGFTRRRGGVSRGEYSSLNVGPHVGDSVEAVAENRRLLSEYLGCEPAWMEQVHGAHMAEASPGATSEQTDGLVLSGPGVAACVMVADCVPLLLLGKGALRGAAVHVGRAGLMKGIAARAVDALGGDAGDLTAVVGPSICGRCYEVSEAMSGEAARVTPSSAAQTWWGTPSIDIPAGLEEQLRALGVADIVIDGRCTLEDADFYSHRRSSREGLRAGRFVGVLQFLGDTPVRPRQGEGIRHIP
ncbi:polyphenol oxidase family protein [Actinomycetaceae bacterium L2_0104]